MIKSMTGFASLTHDDERGTLGRDDSIGEPPVPGFADAVAAGRSPISRRDCGRSCRNISRGAAWKCRCRCSCARRRRRHVELNEEFAQALAAAVEQARSRGVISGMLTAGDLLRLPQALSIREQLPEAGGVSAMLGTAVDDAVLTAIQQLEEMRVREGAHLRTDLDTRKALLLGLIARISTAANTGREALEARLLERAREIATDAAD